MLAARAESAAPAPVQIATHPARYDAQGVLLPWTSWTDAIEREVKWYARCPQEKGYPIFVTVTFMDGAYRPLSERTDFIPATQCSTGILSYLKYYKFTGGQRPELLSTARAFGDYLIDQALTPNEGIYPRFPRSTGVARACPQAPNCGRQEDKPYEIQPDKGGLVAHALLSLYSETKDARYQSVALHIARVLAATMQAGGASHSPWPFRADYRTGATRGPVSSNMVYILRTWDELIAAGNKEFETPRAALWKWITTYQLPSARGEGELWVHFFEDHDKDYNRNAWSPLNLARYLIEKKEALSPTWQQDAKDLIEFVNQTFTRVRFGVVVCGEQDRDTNPWGGILSTYGAVLASYSAATGSPEYRHAAHQALVLCLYATAADGSPRDSVHLDQQGGWQEDAHTDKLHNLITAVEAFPEWDKAGLIPSQ